MREISVIELSTLVTHRPRGTRFMATHPISRTVAFSGSASMNRSCHLQPLMRRSASHAIAWRSQSAIISWAMGVFCLQMRARNDARKGSHQGSDRGLSMSMHVGALIALLRVEIQGKCHISAPHRSSSTWCPHKSISYSIRCRVSCRRCVDQSGGFGFSGLPPKSKASMISAMRSGCEQGPVSPS
jgi:hypothetical protein